MRCAFLPVLLLLASSSAHALEVDASKFGFTFRIPKGWKLLGNANPLGRGLFVVEKDRKAGMVARVSTNYVFRGRICIIQRLSAPWRQEPNSRSLKARYFGHLPTMSVCARSLM
jgi:hypothetical protein